MKKHVKQNSYPAYPNAADKNYIMQKTTDLITALVSCAGLAAAIVFLAAFL